MQEVGVARAQLEAVPWSSLRANGGSGEDVRDLLTTMLFADDDAEIDQAYRQIENQVTAQGDLSPCAPAVVSVIMAAAAERGPDDRNLGWVFDLLGLTLVGFTATWEVELGTRGIRAACYREAMRGYWSLRRLAGSPGGNPSVPDMAAGLVGLLEDEAAEPAPDRTG